MIREFNSYKNILAIDPGVVATGWAVLSENTGQLLACGIARPFAQVSQTYAICEIRKKLLGMWEERVGFSAHPNILAIEMPQIYQQKFLKGDPNDLGPLFVLGGMMMASMSAANVYTPRPATWKGQIPKNVHEARIVASLDTKSKKVFAEELHVIPRTLRHNAYDAVGLGQWAYKKWKGEQAESANKELQYA